MYFMTNMTKIQKTIRQKNYLQTIKQMNAVLHVLPAPVEEMLWVQRKPVGSLGLLSLDDSSSLAVGEDAGNSHGRMKGFVSCVPEVVLC